MAGFLFRLTTAVRVNWHTVARSWTQFESQLPQWKIEPVSVEVKENDTKLEGYQVFEKLVELSGIEQTPDQVISDLWFEKMTNSQWELKFWNEWNNELIDRFGLCQKFLSRNYHRRWAYVKVWDKELYGMCQVWTRRFHMRTPEGILTMPAMWIADQRTGENNYVFFPVKALLSESEQALFELYRTAQPTSPGQRAILEREIMERLTRLSELKDTPQTILDTNTTFNEIEAMCKNSGVIKKLYIQDWKLVLDFDWRVVMDSDQERNWMVLPPFSLLIDLRNYTVRWNRCYHPHIMWDYSLCMGWRLTDLVQKCITERDLKTLVGGMIDFGNSWTSSDADDSDRHPADCILRYYQDNGVADWTAIPVTKEDIEDTLYERGYERSDLGSSFSHLFD